LIPELVAAGHEVVTMTRTAAKQDGLRGLGRGRLSPTLSIPMRWLSGGRGRAGGDRASAHRFWRRRSTNVASRWSATLAGSGSFLHIEDAAAATVAAVERGQRGVYNVVDDDPAPVRE
jgi:nucleoside-diphosphate-sugar epimerase